ERSKPARFPFFSFRLPIFLVKKCRELCSSRRAWVEGLLAGLQQNLCGANVGDDAYNLTVHFSPEDNQPFAVEANDALLLLHDILRFRVSRLSMPKSDFPQHDSSIGTTSPVSSSL